MDASPSGKGSRPRLRPSFETESETETETESESETECEAETETETETATETDADLILAEFHPDGRSTRLGHSSPLQIPSGGSSNVVKRANAEGEPR